MNFLWIPFVLVIEFPSAQAAYAPNFHSVLSIVIIIAAVVVGASPDHVTLVIFHFGLAFSIVFPCAEVSTSNVVSVFFTFSFVFFFLLCCFSTLLYLISMAFVALAYLIDKFSPYEKRTSWISQQIIKK